MACNRLARRPLKPLPKEGLFLFEVDNKTDVRKTITILESQDEVYEGNVVTVLYGPEKLRAKIIKLSGMLSYKQDLHILKPRNILIDYAIYTSIVVAYRDIIVLRCLFNLIWRIDNFSDHKNMLMFKQL